MSADAFYKNFAEAAKDERPRLVSELLLSSRDGFRHIVQVGAVRSLDEDGFVQGLAATLAQDAENLPALRLLAWHQIRVSAWDAAKQTLRKLIDNWPNVPDARRELARVGMMAPGPDGDEIAKIALPELRTPLARASYGSQLYVSKRQSVPPEMRAALEFEIDLIRGEIIKASAVPDPVLPAQSHTSLLDALTKIIAAKSIALVANGPSLKGSKAGEVIDAHDLIIRCNFSEFTKFAEDVGNRVDLVFFNESLVNALPTMTVREAAYGDCLALAFHPEPEALFPKEVYARNMTSRISRIQPKLREFYRSFFYNRSTTGLMGIVLISVVLNKDLSIFGFDFYGQDRVHYFPSSAPVFLGHELQYEKWFLQDFLPGLGVGKVSPDGTAARRQKLREQIVDSRISIYTELL
jgi:hypothetical protein